MKKPNGPGWRKGHAFHVLRDTKGNATAKKVPAWEWRLEWQEEDLAESKAANRKKAS